MTGESAPFTVTVVLTGREQTGGGFHQAITSLTNLATHFPPNFRLRILDEKNTFGQALTSLIEEGVLKADNIDVPPRRLPTFRDRVVVEDGLLFGFIRWILSLRGVSVRSSLVARYLDQSDTDLVYFVTPTAAAHELHIKPFVWTLWDLCHLDSPEFPEVRTSGKFEGREASISRNLRKAALVVVDSAELEENARKSYGITADKFVRIPFSPSTGIRESKHGATIAPAAVADIAGKYVFYPAQLWSHKNHRRIAEAIALLKDKGQDVHAVFVGKDHGAEPSLRRHIHALGVEDNVRFLGYVNDEDLPHLYQCSLGLVMASYFGPTNIPPLEALALGVPVIASETHRAQLGSAAEYFNPDSTEDLARAIERINVPRHRTTLSQQGKKLLSELDQRRIEGSAELSRRIELLAARLLR